MRNFTAVKIVVQWLKLVSGVVALERDSLFPLIRGSYVTDLCFVPLVFEDFLLYKYSKLSKYLLFFVKINIDFIS